MSGLDRAATLEPDRRTREAWLRALAAFLQDHIDALPGSPACGAPGRRGSRDPPGDARTHRGRAAPRRPRAGDRPPGSRGGSVLQHAGARATSPTSRGAASTPRPSPTSRPTCSIATPASRPPPPPRGPGNGSASVARPRVRIRSAGARPLHHRGVPRQLDGRRRRPTRRLRRLGRLPQGHGLHLEPGPPQRGQGAASGRDPSQNLRAIAVDGRYRLRPGRPRATRTGRSSRGPPPLPRRGRGGDDQHGRGRPPGRVASLCAEQRIWMHVDGAYGGAFVLCEEGRERLAGIDRADSIAFDPHKGMFLPYGTGCLLAREGETLRAAHAGVGRLPAGHRPRSGSAPESRRPRPGAVTGFPWPPGLAPADASRGGRLPPRPCREARSRPRVPPGPRASARGGAASPDRGRAPAQRRALPSGACARRERCRLEPAQRRPNEGINAKGRVFLSSTLLPGEDGDVFTLRVCVLSFRTHAGRWRRLSRTWPRARVTPRSGRARIPTSPSPR